MPKKIKFSLLHNNKNLEVNFSINENVDSIKKVSVLIEDLLQTIDEKTKREISMTEGDIIQALTIVIAVRIGISKFNHKSLFKVSQSMVLAALDNIAEGKEEIIGNA